MKQDLFPQARKAVEALLAHERHCDKATANGTRYAGEALHKKSLRLGVRVRDQDRISPGYFCGARPSGGKRWHDQAACPCPIAILFPRAFLGDLLPDHPIVCHTLKPWGWGYGLGRTCRPGTHTPLSWSLPRVCRLNWRHHSGSPI
jgi:hypothetical protein